VKGTRKGDLLINSEYCRRERRQRKSHIL